MRFGVSPRPAAAAALGAHLRPELAAVGEQAFARFVRSSPDARLERVVGSGLGLRVLFAGMAQRFVPEKADGFEGELAYELRTGGGALKRWVVEVRGGRARPRRGAASDPRVTVRMALVDFVRMAGQDLEPAAALLTGRMDLDGDRALALRLGEMFGQDAAL